MKKMESNIFREGSDEKGINTNTVGLGERGTRTAESDDTQMSQE